MEIRSLRRPAHATDRTRRRFLSTAAIAGLAMTLRPHLGWAADLSALDPRTDAIVRKTIGIDTHNHIDVPMTADAVPGPDIDLAGEMKKSGLSAICATFATDYQPGNAYERFNAAIASLDHELQINHITRALTADDIHAAHHRHEPTVIQSVEGAHFLEGRLERVEEAYRRGLRHFGLLHDSDAPTPLGDVYTNPPKFGGMTPFGISVVRECNRLGMLIDLAHCDRKTTQDALRVSTKPMVISHTGPDWKLGSNPRMAQMMRPRLIGKEQAKAVATAGGAVGVWLHLTETPLEYAQNLRALADIIGVEHVLIGTDTKLTTPTPWHMGPPPGGPKPENGATPDGGPKPDSGPGDDHRPGPPQGGPPPGGPQRPHFGERTNQPWEGATAGFYYVVVDAMLKTGFTPDEIAKIGGGNYLRIFAQATGA